MKTVIAVIGCGRIAYMQHFPALGNMEGVRIKYACDIILEKAEKMKAEYPSVENAIEDYRIALADEEVEAVWVLTPNYLHYTITMDALRAGKHVFCEKPVTVNYALSCEMAEEAKKRGLLLDIGVCNRFAEPVEMLERWNKDGKFGNIYHVYCSFRGWRNIPGLGGAFTNKAESGGGVLIDWGVHFLDIVMYCLGAPTVKAVSSESFCKLGKNIEDYTYVTMWAGPPKKDGTYDVDDSITGIIRTDGPVINFNGAWAQNIGEDEMFIDFMGDKAGIRLQYGKNFVKYGVHNKMLSKTEYQFTPTKMFQNEIDAFVRCIQTGEKLPSNIDITIKTAKIMEGIYESAKKHKEVEF